MVNTLTLYLSCDVYIFISHCIKVFKSIAPIIGYYKLSTDRFNQKESLVDSMGNAYIINKKIVIYNYANLELSYEPHKYYIENCIIKTFEFDHCIYDINGFLLYDNMIGQFNHTCNPRKKWKKITIRHNNIAYEDSLGNLHNLNEELYCEINNLYNKCKKMNHLKTKIIEITNETNIIVPSKKIGALELYMCIKFYLNNKCITIDKHIIIKIIEQYKEYLDKIYLISQCAQAIDFIDVTQELYTLALNKYAKAIKYFINDGINEKLMVETIKCNPKVIKYLDIKYNDLISMAVQLNGNTIKYIKNKTHELCLSAVIQNEQSFKYIGDIYNDVTLIALAKDGALLKYVKNKTHDLCLLAVSNNGSAICFVEDQTDEICKLAIKKGGPLYEIRNITLELAMLAVEVNGEHIEFVQRELITMDMCITAAKNGLTTIEAVPDEFITDELYECMLPLAPYYVIDMDNPKEQHWITALQHDGMLLRDLINKSPKLCFVAIMNNPLALKYVPLELQTDEICILAVTKNVKALKYIEEQPYNLCKLAVTINGKAIKYIKKQTEELRFIATSNDK